MDEKRARRVVDALRELGVPAHMAQPRAGVSQFGVRVVLSDDREAVWDTDGTAGLEAQVMRNGMLVGFVPVIEGSEDFTEEQVVDATETAFGSASDLASAFRRAEAAHGEHEKRTGQRDANWAVWYAAYMVAEQSGVELPA